MRRERLPADERRRQILDAAAVLFRRRHYAEVSLDEVAERAGVTRGLINHHFGTKRGLYVAVVRRLLDVGDVPVPEYVHGQSLRDRLDASVAGWLDSVERNRDLWLDSTHAQGLGDPEILAAIEETREHVIRRIAAVMGLGPVDELSDRELAYLRICEAGAESAAVQWLQYGRLTREDVHGLVFEIFDEGGKRLLPHAAGGPTGG